MVPLDQVFSNDLEKQLGPRPKGREPSEYFDLPLGEEPDDIVVSFEQITEEAK